MALLNGLYIFVSSESVSRSIESTSHPTEKGLPITSTIQYQPVELSLSGYIVDNEKYNTKNTKDKIVALMKEGSLVEYKGRNVLPNMQIQSFDGDFDNKTWKGFSFSMTLKQVRIANTSYVKKESKKETVTKQKEEKKKNPPKPDLQVGSTVVFKGGNVYVASDSAKPAANRGRSTCKITYTNTRSWSKHPYCLQSSDGGRVYGWVDKANIEGVPSSSTDSKKNGGTQQTSKGKGTAVYHTVKKGDTLYDLTYKYKTEWDCKEVMDNNPKAFSKPNDAKTLKVGSRLLMGYK